MALTFVDFPLIHPFSIELLTHPSKTLFLLLLALAFMGVLDHFITAFYYDIGVLIPVMLHVPLRTFFEYQ